MSMHLLKGLGLSLLVALGLMAVATAEVQAANLKPSEHVHGEILISGKKLHVTAILTAETSATLLVPLLGIEITCKTFKSIQLLFNETAEKGRGTAEVILEGCGVYSIEKSPPFNLTSKVALPCLPLDSVSGKDGDIRLKATLLVVLHENKDYVVAEALNLTGSLAEIVFSPETGCPVPLKPKVTGEVVSDIPTGDLHIGSEALEPLIAGASKVVQELFGVKLLYGTNESLIDYSARISLIGIHIGSKWGVL